MSAATEINESREQKNEVPLVTVNARSDSTYYAAANNKSAIKKSMQKMAMPVVLGYSATVITTDIKVDIKSDVKTSVIDKLNEERNEKYQLQLGDNQPMASAAEGLLVTPNVGDVVLCVEVEGSLIISQVLKRTEKSSSLVMVSSRPIEWVAPVLRFKALKEMELLAVNKLTLSASDLVFGAARTLVQQARNFIQQAKNYSLTTKDLMRLNARQQIIIAEEDIRIDAKRINMG
jgi:hypothetical protein